MNSLSEHYAEEHSTPEDDYLYRLYRATNNTLLYPRMASGHMQGLMLRMICRMLKPRRVLEIGTYSGYSALSMASGMDEGTRIISYEVNDEQEVFTRPWLDGSPYPADVEMRIGDARELLKDEGDEFDLVFIDGNKRDYIEYYELAMRLLRKGGFILADNTLWDGHVADPNYKGDAQTKGIRDFNEYVQSDERVENIILALRDGISIIYKK